VFTFLGIVGSNFCVVLREEEIKCKAFLEKLIVEHEQDLKEMLRDNVDWFDFHSERIGGE
jgi:hypothetical protein